MLHGEFCVDTGDTRRDRALSPEEVDEGSHGIIAFPAVTAAAVDATTTVTVEDDPAGVELDVTGRYELARLWLLSPSLTLGRGALVTTLRDEGEHEAAPHGTPGPPWRCHRWVVDVDPASVTGPPLHLPPEEAAASRPAQGDRVLLTVDRREDGAARRITIDLRVLGG
ncbi:hypothetical protein [Brachybacterium squillarum]|uniref:hypothetical protein n=1 Tax=Brachybacterium squillarum TaxID=661979 RepID=UPI002221B71D|nr:hypothetical protein [Brachybacterium squillarum]MCW1804397.1 hypothetical protein [Brachybacterium squillarum]